MRKSILIVMVFVLVVIFSINICYAQQIKEGDILQADIIQSGMFHPTGDITLGMKLKDGRMIYGRLALVESFPDATGAAAVVSWMILHPAESVYVRIVHDENGFYTVMVNSMKSGSYNTDMAYNMVYQGAAQMDGWCELEENINASLCTNFLAAQLDAKKRQRGLWDPSVPKVPYGDMVKF